jgi:hypothetical protein
MYEQAGQVVLEIPLRPRILRRLVVMSGRRGHNSSNSSYIRNGYQ